MRRSDLNPILAAARDDINTEAKGEGPIAEFERQFAQLTGSQYALAMNSGTAALHSAYFALGVKPGREAILPGYTFFATAAPILQCGGRLVFCDVDPGNIGRRSHRCGAPDHAAHTCDLRRPPVGKPRAHGSLCRNCAPP